MALLGILTAFLEEILQTGKKKKRIKTLLNNALFPAIAFLDTNTFLSFFLCGNSI